MSHLFLGQRTAADGSGGNHSLGLEVRGDPCSAQPKGEIEAGRFECPKNQVKPDKGIDIPSLNDTMPKAFLFYFIIFLK